jgi:hypothetical protein
VDYIERIFGISPDAGNGSFELFLLTFCLISAIAFIAGRSAHFKRRRAHLDLP